MSKNHRDQRYYELGCQAMGEAMALSARRRQHLSALEAVADAAQELANEAIIVSGPLDGYYHRAHHPYHWRALADALGALKGGQ